MKALLTIQNGMCLKMFVVPREFMCMVCVVSYGMKKIDG